MRQALQPPRASQVRAWGSAGRLFHRALGGVRAGDENQKEENISSPLTAWQDLLSPVEKDMGPSPRAGKESPGASWPACLPPAVLRTLDQSVLKFSGYSLLLRTFLRAGLWYLEPWNRVSSIHLCSKPYSRDVLQCSGGVLRCSEPSFGSVLWCSEGALQYSEPWISLALFRASLMLRALHGGSCGAQGMLRACARVSCAAGASFPPAQCPLLEQRFWGPPLVGELGSVGAGTGSCVGSRAHSIAGARCFPDVTHFLSGFSVFSFLCTCLFWTTNKIKKVFITLFPWGCEFRI